MGTPPPGETPALEWYRYPRRASVLVAIVAVALMLVFGYVKDPSMRWLSIWWVWLIAVVCAGGLALSVRGAGFSVGADWFARAGFGGRPGAYVHTYELTSITTSLEALREDALDLTDSAGRTVHIRLSVVQLWPPAWDLLYNGILHSIRHNDATTDDRVRDLLQDGNHLDLAEHAAQRAQRARDG